MKAAIAQPPFTPEDLLIMSDGDRYELVNGNLVERARSVWVSYVAGTILCALLKHCAKSGLGWVFPGGVTYQCFPTARHNVRKPDVSFIHRERLTVKQFMEPGHTYNRPDLAVEVISPGDTVDYIQRKLEDYGGADIPLVWVVNARERTVRVIRSDGSDDELRANDEITGEDLIPGFRCAVREFFQLPPGVTPTSA